MKSGYTTISICRTTLTTWASCSSSLLSAPSCDRNQYLTRRCKYIPEVASKAVNAQPLWHPTPQCSGWVPQWPNSEQHAATILKRQGKHFCIRINTYPCWAHVRFPLVCLPHLTVGTPAGGGNGGDPDCWAEGGGNPGCWARGSESAILSICSEYNHILVPGLHSLWQPLPQWAGVLPQYPSLEQQLPGSPIIEQNLPPPWTPHL